VVAWSPRVSRALARPAMLPAGRAQWQRSLLRRLSSLMVLSGACTGAPRRAPQPIDSRTAQKSVWGGARGRNTTAWWRRARVAAGTSRVPAGRMLRSARRAGGRWASEVEDCQPGREATVPRERSGRPSGAAV